MKLRTIVRSFGEVYWDCVYVALVLCRQIMAVNSSRHMLLYNTIEQGQILDGVVVWETSSCKQAKTKAVTSNTLSNNLPIYHPFLIELPSDRT